MYFSYESYIFAYLWVHCKNLKTLCLQCGSRYENSITIKGERFGKCKYMLTAVCFLNSVTIFKISYICHVTHFSSAQLLAVFFSTIKNDHLLLYCSRWNILSLFQLTSCADTTHCSCLQHFTLLVYYFMHALLFYQLLLK